MYLIAIIGTILGIVLGFILRQVSRQEVIELLPDYDLRQQPPRIKIDNRVYVAEEPKVKTIHGKTGEVVIGGFKEVKDDET